MEPTADPWVPQGNTTKSNKEDAITTNTDIMKEKKNDATSTEKDPKSIKTTNRKKDKKI